jgi:hypothetical protein
MLVAEVFHHLCVTLPWVKNGALVQRNATCCPYHLDREGANKEIFLPSAAAKFGILTDLHYLC